MVLITTGCATNYLSNFYVDTTGNAPVPKEFKGIVPQAHFTEDLQGEVTRLVKEEDYTIVGYSDYWSSQTPTIPDLQRKAKKVGATHVICQTRYKETVT